MKSNAAIHVTLWGDQVGTLFWAEKETLSYFEFDPLFRCQKNNRCGQNGNGHIPRNS